jgi:hypothetical protein
MNFKSRALFWPVIIRPLKADYGVENVFPPATLLSALGRVMHNHDRHTATVQAQQPILNRAPTLSIIVANDGGKAREIVKDKKVSATEPRVEFGLHLRRSEIADAAFFDEIARENVRRPHFFGSTLAQLLISEIEQAASGDSIQTEWSMPIFFTERPAQLAIIASELVTRTDKRRGEWRDISAAAAKIH